MKDQIIRLCVDRRNNVITLEEFGQRLLVMIQDPDSLESIAVDVDLLIQERSDKQ